MRLLVLGVGGMVGRVVAEHARAAGDEVFALDRARLDITDKARVEAAFDEARPEAVINCAAWTDVDGCELDPQRAYDTNGRAVEHLAASARRHDAAFVTISTDYVFDGRKDGFYTQRDDPNPESVYGKAKLQGERYAQCAYARSVVVRTGWIFGAGGRNFLATVVERARRGERLHAIRDAYGTPTYAPDLAARLRELALLDLPGVYHVANAGGGASFEEFARAAVEVAGCANVDIESVSMDSLEHPAPRPRNSRLRCLISERLGLAPLPDWREALGRHAAQTVAAADGART
ncbi:MAG TPA: dTDP-4-dehydrorhamnose reductase [Pyrinomonadaceae bacterium]|nr:dTDP-4-dehydrorhamnose reductase [Pyrinomonadaceae bacterium]